MNYYLQLILTLIKIGATGTACVYSYRIQKLSYAPTWVYRSFCAAFFIWVQSQIWSLFLTKSIVGVYVYFSGWLVWKGQIEALLIPYLLLIGILIKWNKYKDVFGEGK
jgi:hypothetical protein